MSRTMTISSWLGLEGDLQVLGRVPRGARRRSRRTCGPRGSGVSTQPVAVGVLADGDRGSRGRPARCAAGRPAGRSLNLSGWWPSVTELGHEGLCGSEGRSERVTELDGIGGAAGGRAAGVGWSGCPSSRCRRRRRSRAAPTRRGSRARSARRPGGRGWRGAASRISRASSCASSSRRAHLGVDGGGDLVGVVRLVAQVAPRNGSSSLLAELLGPEPVAHAVLR